MQPNILLIEDESAIADVVLYNLQKEGFRVCWEKDGISGLLKAQTIVPDLCLLDVMLPGIDGLQICRVLKSDAKTQSVLVMMLTARSEEKDEVLGFNLGADDYVTKPFRIQPLIHRIKALLRRTEAAEVSKNFIRSHGIELDRRFLLATLNGNDLKLTPTEFLMLWTLMAQPGRAFSRGELMESCRGDEVNTLERTIDVHMLSLRKKLQDCRHLVETARGIGYRFSRK